MFGKKVYNEDGEPLKIKCPICNTLAFPFHGSYDVCPKCGWIDEPFQEENPNEDGGVNFMSLNQARQAWKEGKPIS